MKKTIFTICSVLTVCAVIVMSCQKEDTTAKKVYYNTQPGYSTGGNPNPNGTPSSSGGGVSATSSSSSSGTASTGSSCTNAMTYGSATCTSVSAAGGVVSGTYKLVHSGSCIQVQITFPGGAVPASGSYSIPGQCTFLDATNSVSATGGTVTVTTGTPNKVTYSSITVGSSNVSGTACF
jgi:hypothetical protein